MVFLRNDLLTYVQELCLGEHDAITDPAGLVDSNVRVFVRFSATFMGTVGIYTEVVGGEIHLRGILIDLS